MTSLSEQKAILRSKSLALRDAINPADRIELSLRACEFGEQLDVFNPKNFQPGTVVAGYHPIRSELDPRPLMATLSSLGARLCLPVVMDKTTIEFRELIRTAPLVSSGFGTVGPDEHAQVLDPDIILLPLSVFDKMGGRIGYGAGYYDRAIERLISVAKPPRLLGMAFSIQETSVVPKESHDQPLEVILTENGHLPVDL